MNRLMISTILAAFCLLLLLGLYGFLRGEIEQMQAWGIGGDVIAISPDGKLLAASAGPTQKRQFGNIPIYGGTTVKLYTFPSGEVVRTLEAFYVTRIAFSPDNSLIAASTKFGDIFVWRVSDGQLLYQRKASVIKPKQWYGVYSKGTHTLIFSQDGKTLVSGIEELFDVWQVSDGQLRYSIKDDSHHQFRGDLSCDGKILALFNLGTRTITFYQLSDGTVVRQIALSGFPKFSPDGERLAIYRQNDYGQNVISLYRLKDENFEGDLVVEKEVSLDDFVFSADGRYIAAFYQTGGSSADVFMIVPQSFSPLVWHLNLWRLDDLSKKSVYPWSIKSEKKVFTAIAFSPDGSMLVTGGDKIRLWRLP